MSVVQMLVYVGSLAPSVPQYLIYTSTCYILIRKHSNKLMLRCWDNQGQLDGLKT